MCSSNSRRRNVKQEHPRCPSQSNFDLDVCRSKGELRTAPSWKCMWMLQARRARARRLRCGRKRCSVTNPNTVDAAIDQASAAEVAAAALAADRRADHVGLAYLRIGTDWERNQECVISVPQTEPYVALSGYRLRAAQQWPLLRLRCPMAVPRAPPATAIRRAFSFGCI
jgi:hypothetical protein